MRRSRFDDDDDDADRQAERGRLTKERQALLRTIDDVRQLVAMALLKFKEDPDRQMDSSELNSLVNRMRRFVEPLRYQNTEAALAPIDAPMGVNRTQGVYQILRQMHTIIKAALKSRLQGVNTRAQLDRVARDFDALEVILMDYLELGDPTDMRLMHRDPSSRFSDVLGPEARGLISRMAMPCLRELRVNTPTSEYYRPLTSEQPILMGYQIADLGRPGSGVADAGDPYFLSLSNDNSSVCVCFQRINAYIKRPVSSAAEARHLMLSALARGDGETNGVMSTDQDDHTGQNFVRIRTTKFQAYTIARDGGREEEVYLYENPDPSMYLEGIPELAFQLDGVRRCWPLDDGTFISEHRFTNRGSAASMWANHGIAALEETAPGHNFINGLEEHWFFYHQRRDGTLLRQFDLFNPAAGAVDEATGMVLPTHSASLFPDYPEGLDKHLLNNFRPRVMTTVASNGRIIAALTYTEMTGGAHPGVRQLDLYEIQLVNAPQGVPVVRKLFSKARDWTEWAVNVEEFEFEKRNMITAACRKEGGYHVTLVIRSSAPNYNCFRIEVGPGAEQDVNDRSLYFPDAIAHDSLEYDHKYKQWATAAVDSNGVSIVSIRRNSVTHFGVEPVSRVYVIVTEATGEGAWRHLVVRRRQLAFGFRTDAPLRSIQIGSDGFVYAIQARSVLRLR